MTPRVHQVEGGLRPGVLRIPQRGIAATASCPPAQPDARIISRGNTTRGLNKNRPIHPPAGEMSADSVNHPSSQPPRRTVTQPNCHSAELGLVAVTHLVTGPTKSQDPTGRTRGLTLQAYRLKTDQRPTPDPSWARHSSRATHTSLPKLRCRRTGRCTDSAWPRPTQTESSPVAHRWGN